MSSYMMHLCISNKVKEKLDLTDDFLYGSILPDILKQSGESRNKNHYIKDTKVNGKIRQLPDIKTAITEIVVGKNKEQELGVIAHLIEDYIWFNTYIPSYAEKIEDGKVIYLKNNSLHTQEEFKQDMYNDYSRSNNYVSSIIGQDEARALTNRLINMAELDIHKKIINEGTIISAESNLEKNTFMTKESIDSYIYQATNEVERVITKLLGDNNE